MGKSQSKERMASSKAGGFQHNNVYRFINMKDKSAIELPVSSTGSGTPFVVGKSSSSASSQKFKVVQISPGEFQISSLVQLSGDGDTMVWDFMPGDGLLIQNTASTGANQTWVAEEIFPNSKICLIKSKNDGRCIRNMGVGKQLGLVSEDRRDAHLHWKLETTF